MLCCSSIGQLLIIQLIIWIQTTLLCCRRWCGHGTIRWMCSGCVLMWLQIEVDHLCHHCTPPGSVYSTARTWYTRKNTFYPDLLHYWSVENKEYYIWFIAADETARPHYPQLRRGIRSWPPPVSDRRPWYLAAAHCCYYLLPHRNTQSPANDRFGNFSERSQVGHGCCHVTC